MQRERDATKFKLTANGFVEEQYLLFIKIKCRKRLKADAAAQKTANLMLDSTKAAF